MPNDMGQTKKKKSVYLWELRFHLDIKVWKIN